MKKYLLLFCFFVLKTSFAQKQNVYNLVLKDISFTCINCKFYVDSVIDNRFLKGAFGGAQKGLGNRKVPIVMPDGMAAIKNYLDKNLPKRQEDFIPVTIVINQLWLSERTSVVSEFGRCDLEMEFCTKDSSGRLWSVYEFIGKLEEKSGIDVTSAHERRLRQLLFDAFNELGKQDFANLQPTLFEIKELDKTNNILNAKSLNKGFYKSFSDLYNNNPITIDEGPVLVPVQQNSNQYKLLDTKNNKRIKNYYGYYDGENIYLNAYSYGQVVANYYSKAISFGPYILLDDKYRDPYVTAALVGGFGLLGGLAATAITHQGMVIDMQTGQPIALSEKAFKKILDAYPDYQNAYNNQQNKDFPAKASFIMKINQLGKTN